MNRTHTASAWRAPVRWTRSSDMSTAYGSWVRLQAKSRPFDSNHERRRLRTHRRVWGSGIGSFSFEDVRDEGMGDAFYHRYGDEVPELFVRLSIRHRFLEPVGESHQPTALFGSESAGILPLLRYEDLPIHLCDSGRSTSLRFRPRAPIRRRTRCRRRDALRHSLGDITTACPTACTWQGRDLRECRPRQDSHSYPPRWSGTGTQARPQAHDKDAHTRLRYKRPCAQQLPAPHIPRCCQMPQDCFNVRPPSCATRFRTFSNTTARGFRAFKIHSISKNSVPCVSSSNPCGRSREFFLLTPAMEKGWHGNPAIRTSCGGTRNFASLMSPCGVSAKFAA